MTVFLLTVQLKSDTDKIRLAEIIPKILQIVVNITNGNHSQFFRASDGNLFGLLLQCDLKSPQIRAALATGAIFQDGDSYIVNELGPDWAGHGFSKAWSWMQHRLEKS